MRLIEKTNFFMTTQIWLKNLGDLWLYNHGIYPIVLDYDIQQNLPDKVLFENLSILFI